MADKKPQKPSSNRNPNPIKKPLASVKNESPFCLGQVTPGQLVTYDPHQVTPINSPTKLSTSIMISLGKPIQQGLSFARALSNDYDPFAKKKTPPVPTKYIKSSPYFPIYSYKLFHVEFLHWNISNPFTLIKYYYPTNPTDGAHLHFAPFDPKKTLEFYQDIFQQEGSVNITTIYDKLSDGRVLYPKLDIIKFTYPKSWGSHLFLLKPFRGYSIKYSYCDYIEAWSKI